MGDREKDMGLFFVTSGPDATGHASRAQRICTKMGFSGPQIFKEEGALIYAYPKRGQNRVNSVSFPNGDFIVACGTFIFQGEKGEAALKRFYNRFAGDFSDLHDAIYGFAIVIKKHGFIHLTNDRSGSYHVFLNERRTVVSSSFLVTASSVDRITLSAQSVYEYVFNGVISGNESLATEISLLPLGASLAITDETITLRESAPTAPDKPASSPKSELVKATIARLDQQFGTLAKLFGDNVTCALSGGYDSRLILSMLRRHGCHPRVFVYGSASDPDVTIASHIARNEGFTLNVIDKQNRDVVDPDEFSETLSRVYFASDGYLWGGIFNNAAELDERAARTANGAIALNGGGGEIFRNFFYLRNTKYSLRQLLWSFYAQFDPSICTGFFDENDYFRGLEMKISELIGSAKRLNRTTIDWLYHRFRCRSWDGRVDTVCSQFGFTGLPFFNAQITDFASQIPADYKKHGLFESELIRIADARLAQYPTVYDHNFLAPPPLGVRMKNLMTYYRPPFLRRLTHRIKHRARGKQAMRGYCAPTYVNTIFPDGLQAMRTFFNIDSVRDPAQFARILTLEYLVQQFGPEVRFSPDR
jgi:hypothetical protein